MENELYLRIVNFHPYESFTLHRLQSGYNQNFSGDVLLILNASTIGRGRTGTTHGSGFNYDSHVPIVFYGKGIKKESSTRQGSITDIAPTLYLI